MFSSARRFPVTCLILSILISPWSQAFASERDVENIVTELKAATLVKGNDGRIVRTASRLVPGLIPSESRLMRLQSVATTNESNLLIGVAAGALIVAGVAIGVYGMTSSCESRHQTDGTCARNKVMGSIGLAGGSAMLLMWTLSR